MPTAATIEGNPLYNLGPLTSTWSAPSSCMTAGFNTALAYTISQDEGVLVDTYLDCKEELWDRVTECFPSGSEYMSIVTSNEEKAEPTYQGHFFHSPGLQCPEEWFTAGAATMMEDGKVVKTGEIFEFYETASAEDIYYKPYAQRFADGLDAGETAIWCCPSDYTVDKAVQACYRTLDVSSVTIAEVCTEIILNQLTYQTQTFTMDGTVLTRSNFLTWTGDLTLSSDIQRTTMEPSYLEEAELTPVVYYPVITMAHKKGDRDDGNDEGSDDDSGGSGNDNDNGNDNGNDSDNDNSDGGNEGDGGNGDNAAVRLVDAGFMAAVIGAAGVLGAALVL